MLGRYYFRTLALNATVVELWICHCPDKEEGDFSHAIVDTAARLLGHRGDAFMNLGGVTPIVRVLYWLRLLIYKQGHWFLCG